jgi:cyclopropane-fatty-acyl-phospholipid synthase
MSRLARKWISKSLSSLSSGKISFQDQHGNLDFGQSGGLSAKLLIKNKKFYSKILWQGSLGPAKSYMDGDWQTDSLTDLIRIIIQNEKSMNTLDWFSSKIPQLLGDFRAKINKNTPSRSRKYIHAHYDLGNDFFKSFLDETLMYSCALFKSPEDTLHNAQLHKIAKITELLSAQPSDHILEIGTGWGAMAIHLAQTVGCRVTTTTISEKQYQHVKQRILELNLEDKITLLKQDYRKLRGQFDKIVSIEMIEAVGHEYFDLFFSRCNDLLKSGGLLVIQGITINEQSYERAKYHVDFIKKYIFPGGCLPSVHRIAKSIATHTRLQWISLNDIGKNYAQTLRHWHQRFKQNQDQVKKLGFSDEFIRLWEYYLCYCEAGFEERYISNVQMVWRKR